MSLSSYVIRVFGKVVAARMSFKRFVERPPAGEILNFRLDPEAIGGHGKSVTVCDCRQVARQQ